VGGAIGLAVLATLATERTGSLVEDGEAVASALNAGFHLAYVVGAGLVAAALAIAVGVIRSPAAPAEAPAETPAPAKKRELKPAYEAA
jgi:hypothetical protein